MCDCIYYTVGRQECYINEKKSLRLKKRSGKYIGLQEDNLSI